jgi:uncharacterized protein YecE (DUF72 family)
MRSLVPIRLGCAGWNLPRAAWPEFPAECSHLERYAARLNAVEINSSFYRPHQEHTYAKWAASVPSGFNFSVKLPKTITHEKRLKGCEALLEDFMAQTGGLGKKLRCVLVQLPPSLTFNEKLAAGFLQAIREQTDVAVALEARHASWFASEPDQLLSHAKVGRVLADPVLFEAGRWPGGDAKTVYVRLHGSPRIYYSAYAPALLDALAARLQVAAENDAAVWCVFDNTASGAAVGDALYTRQALRLCAEVLPHENFTGA